MPMEWKVIAVSPPDAENGTKGWEPFALTKDPDTGEPLVLCKAYVEIEGEKSSTLPENKNWAGNEPDEEDLDLDEEDEDEPHINDADTQ